MIGTGGMFWLSRVNEHSTYASGLLGPMMVTAFGFGLLFVPISLVALSKVREEDTGVASSLLNTGQQVGGSIGLAILGTVAWSAIASNLRSAQLAGAARGRGGEGRPSADHGPAGRGPETQAIHHALAYGFARGYLLSAGIALLALVITVATIRVKRADLAASIP